MEDRNSYVYRGWNVSFDPPPIPSRMFDWCATHPDYDGAEDADDHRIVWGSSRANVQSEVDEWYLDNEEAPRNENLRRGCCAFYIVAAIIVIGLIARNVTWVTWWHHG